MEDMRTVASYINARYAQAYGQRIDEMKLHKLMYFAQRESLIQTGEPLFDATFSGWKYGPVLKDLRQMYKDNSFLPAVPPEVTKELAPVMDSVFEEYSGKDSWSLSRLTHGELSWKNSRAGIPAEDNSDRPIRLEDIRLDADRVRQRREALCQMGLR